VHDANIHVADFGQRLESINVQLEAELLAPLYKAENSYGPAYKRIRESSCIAQGFTRILAAA
jgi:hypothetical protein